MYTRSTLLLILGTLEFLNGGTLLYSVNGTAIGANNGLDSVFRATFLTSDAPIVLGSDSTLIPYFYTGIFGLQITYGDTTVSGPPSEVVFYGTTPRTLSGFDLVDSTNVFMQPRIYPPAPPYLVFIGPQMFGGDVTSPLLYSNVSYAAGAGSGSFGSTLPFPVTLSSVTVVSTNSTPEPAAWTLFTLGMATLLSFHNRRCQDLCKRQWAWIWQLCRTLCATDAGRTTIRRFGLSQHRAQMVTRLLLLVASTTLLSGGTLTVTATGAALGANLDGSDAPVQITFSLRQNPTPLSYDSSIYYYFRAEATNVMVTYGNAAPIAGPSAQVIFYQASAPDQKDAGFDLIDVTGGYVSPLLGPPDPGFLTVFGPQMYMGDLINPILNDTYSFTPSGSGSQGTVFLFPITIANVDVSAPNADAPEPTTMGFMVIGILFILIATHGGVTDQSLHLHTRA